jgi:glucose/mannose-6-phosphate isomerase
MLSRKDVAAIDRSGMLEGVASLPEQIREGMAAGAQAFHGTGGKRVLVIGMGASGIVGDVVASWASGRVGVTAVREALPAVAKGDLAVAVSFSGDTEETLASFSAALDLGCSGAAVTTGGKLRALAAGRNLPVAVIPRKVQARAAFGSLLGPLAALLGRAFERELGEAAKEVEAQRPGLLPEADVPDNKAKALAAGMEGKTVGFLADRTALPVARRWATQLHENAKVLAWASEMPEADHNEIVAWAEDPGEFLPVLLRHAEESEELRRRMELTAEIVAAKRPVLAVDLPGTSRIARLLGGIQVADFTSLYLAALRGVDPTPQRAIDELKRRLRQAP